MPAAWMHSLPATKACHHIPYWLLHLPPAPTHSEKPPDHCISTENYQKLIMGLVYSVPVLATAVDTCHRSSGGGGILIGEISPSHWFIPIPHHSFFVCNIIIGNMAYSLITCMYVCICNVMYVMYVSLYILTNYCYCGYLYLLAIMWLCGQHPHTYTPLRVLWPLEVVEGR